MHVLFRYGADINQRGGMQDGLGLSPLDVAAKYGNLNIEKLIDQQFIIINFMNGFS